MTENEIIESFQKKFIDEKIDFILPFFTDDNYVDSLSNDKKTIFNALFSNEEGRKALVGLTEVMEEEGLLRQTLIEGEAYRGSTIKARRIIRKGGWLKYIDEEENDKQNQRKLNRSVRITNRVQWVAAGMTLIIISANLWVAMENLKISNNAKDSMSKSEQSKLLQDNIAIQKQLLKQTQTEFLYRKYQDSLQRIKPSKSPLQNGNPTGKYTLITEG